MSEVVLNYFPFYGRGDPVRFALFIADIEFRENVIEFQNWGSLKFSGFSEFGQLPTLEIDGRTIGETSAIVLYIMHKANLHPTDPRQAYIIDSTCSALGDVALIISRHFYTKDFEALRAQFANDGDGFKQLRALEARLVRYGQNGFFIGDTATAADATAMGILYNFFVVPLIENGREVLKELPRLKEYLEGFPEKFPKLKQHLETRPARMG